MIRIIVELVPGGDERCVRELSRADLSAPSETPLAGSTPGNAEACSGPTTWDSIWKLVELAAAWAAVHAEIYGHGV